jgi:uncharacterized BrkB/YihY/UPF0761 family membrane protein
MKKIMAILFLSLLIIIVSAIVGFIGHGFNPVHGTYSTFSGVFIFSLFIGFTWLYSFIKDN